MRFPPALAFLLTPDEALLAIGGPPPPLAAVVEAEGDPAAVDAPEPLALVAPVAVVVVFESASNK